VYVQGALAQYEVCAAWQYSTALRQSRPALLCAIDPARSSKVDTFSITGVNKILKEVQSVSVVTQICFWQPLPALAASNRRQALKQLKQRCLHTELST
jgi:hypothetical protein